MIKIGLYLNPMTLKHKKILVSGPSITKKEVNYVAQVTKNCWGENAYKYIAEFEKKFSEYLGVKYALATSSCTGAIHLAFLSLGIKKGDEIIVPDTTWIASVAPIIYMGAKPIFTDIEKDTWCIDPLKIEEKITKKTKAIMPVHLYGNPCAMKEIMNIAKKYKLYIVEDAAESLGSIYFGKKMGSIGDIGCFSFHGSKIITTEEGGMLVTNNKTIYERSRFLNDHGKDPKRMFWNLEVGYKYKMSDMQAALGVIQLSRLDELVSKKRKIFFWYKKRLGNIPGIKINIEKKNCRNNYWMVTIILDEKFRFDKIHLMRALEKYNISSRPFFYPLSMLPPLKAEVDNPVSYQLSKYGINLPCGLNLTEKDVRYICKCLFEILDIKKSL